MSENLDLVRSIYAEWERGEYGRVGWADPEIEFVVADGPSPGSWTGVAAMAYVWREVMTSFTGFGAVAEQYRVLDDDRILVLNRNTGRGTGSGLEVDEIPLGGASIFRVHGGKVTRLVLYWEGKRALVDLDLAESAMSEENVEIEGDPEDAPKALLDVDPEAEPLEDPDKEPKLDLLRKASADELADPSIRVKLVQEAREAGATQDEINAALDKPDPGP